MEKRNLLYSPSHYKESRTELNLDVIRRFEFATLISTTPQGPFVSHLPLLLDDGDQVLLGHCARANPHWRHFAEPGLVTAIFNGPHAYISPAWYEEKPDNVPTWNYVAVHVRARAEIIEDETTSYGILQKLVTHFETKYKTGWSLADNAQGELSSLLKAIVSFRLHIETIEGKFKLSQKLDDVSRENVIAQLPSFMGPEGTAVAEYMKLVRKPR